MALKEEFERQGNWLFEYRGILPVPIILIGLAVSIHSNALGNRLGAYDLYYEIGCLLISLIGLAIRVYTVGHTPKNTSGRNTVEGQVADTLNTTGIYSTVRNPLYLGNFFMWFGLALLTQDLWFLIAFVLFFWIYYERIIFAEEQFLERKFGYTYKAWAWEVPVFLPNPFMFEKPETAFSTKKVLKKEKNGLLYMFLVFTLFDITGTTVRNQGDFNRVFLVGFATSLVVYILIKLIEKTTTLLNEDRQDPDEQNTSRKGPVIIKKLYETSQN